MTLQAIETAPTSRHPLLRGAGAVFAGLAAIVVLSTVTDQALHATGVYPPDGQPMYDDGLFALALAYRSLYGVIAGIITAWLAPSHKLRHAMILAGIGVVLSILGAIAMWNMGPAWYPLAVIAICVPTAWLGARLYLRNAR